MVTHPRRQRVATSADGTEGFSLIELAGSRRRSRPCRSSVASMATSSRASPPAWPWPTSWPMPAFRGRLRLVPVAHEAAHVASLRSSPIDGRNLARTFPGDPAGEPTERLAAALRERRDRSDRTSSSTSTVPGPRTRCRCSSAGATTAVRPVPAALPPPRRSPRRSCGDTPVPCRPAGPCPPPTMPTSRRSTPRRPAAAAFRVPRPTCTPPAFAGSWRRSGCWRSHPADAPAPTCRSDARRRGRPRCPGDGRAVRRAVRDAGRPARPGPRRRRRRDRHRPD